MLTQAHQRLPTNNCITLRWTNDKNVMRVHGEYGYTP
jgi:hypothetical protein